MFSTILDYLFTALGFLIAAAIAYGVFKAIYLRVSFVFKPYNQKVNELSRRKKKAIKVDSYKDLQQVALEELWLETYKISIRNNITFLESYSMDKHAVEDKVYTSLSQKLKMEDFVLPNVHNVEEKAIAYDFLDDLLHKSETARAESPYAETFYFPESVLPFPKEYLLFGLTYLNKCCEKAQEKNDSFLERLLEKDIRNLRYFTRLLNLRCVDISADLLSTEDVANRQTGDRLKGVGAETSSAPLKP